MAYSTPQSVAKRVMLKVYLTDGLTEATGKTVAIVISKNGGAFANPAAGATNASEVSVGWYYVDLAIADFDTLGPIVVRGTGTGCDPVERLFYVVNAHNAGFDGVPNAAAKTVGGLPVGMDTNGRVDLGSWLGVAPAALTATGKFVQAAVLRWLTDDAAGTPSALSASGYLQSMLMRWLTDNAAGTPDALSSGKVPADVKLWLTTAPATVTATGHFIQAALERWLTDDAAGTPDALSTNKIPADVKLWLTAAPAAVTTNGYLQTTVLRWLTDNAAGTPLALTAAWLLQVATITGGGATPQQIWDALITLLITPGSIGELMVKMEKKVDDTTALILTK